MALWAVACAPPAEYGHDRDELDRGLGETVFGAVTAAGLRPGEETVGDQLPEAVGEDVRGDSLFRAFLQDAEVSPVAEYDIAQDQQRPAVADHLYRGVDRVARTRLV
jgi:hypothetical protein